MRHAILVAVVATALAGCPSPTPPVAEPTPTPTPAVAVPTPTPAPKPKATPTPKPSPTPGPTPSAKPRERIIAEASKLIGLGETDGPNRSKVIDAMNRLTGAEMGSPWCASFNAYVYDKAAIPKGWPKSAWSRTGSKIRLGREPKAETRRSLGTASGSIFRAKEGSRTRG
jgi:hypothetical protein